MVAHSNLEATAIVGLVVVTCGTNALFLSCVCEPSLFRYDYTMVWAIAEVRLLCNTQLLNRIMGE